VKATRQSLKKGFILFSISALALMTMFATIAPALAETSKKILVTFTRGGIYWTLGNDFWTTPSNTYHSRGSLFGFSTYTVTGSSINLVGSSLSIVDQNEDLNTGEGEQHFRTVITLSEGTFEGITQIRGLYKTYTSINYPGFLAAINTVQKAAYHGTGLYQGWTLELETATGQPVTGYVLMPNNN
jgi:hypothetical protein